MHRFAPLACAFLPCAFLPCAALATPVSVDPGAYTGMWVIGGSMPDWARGSASVDLAPGGTYQLTIGPYNGFTFSLDAAGNVVLGAGADAKAVAAGSALALKTVPVGIDPGLYAGLWAMDRADPDWTAGASTVALPPGGYVLEIGPYNGFFFSVGSAGDVTITNSTFTPIASDKAVAQGGTLHLQTLPLTVDPGAYAGSWAMDRAEPFGLSGQHVVDLPPGPYVVGAGAYAGFFLILDGSGAVTLTDSSFQPLAGDSSQATAGVLLVQFKTMPISIDPAGYQGNWGLDRGTPGWMKGPAALDLVPGQWRIAVGAYNAWILRVHDDGSVESLDATRATASGSTLTFVTLEVTVSGSGTWALDTASPLEHGTATLTLVPGAYALSANGAPGVLFTVSSACALDPSSVAGFALSCAAEAPPQATCVGTAAAPAVLEPAPGTCGALAGPGTAGSCSGGACSFDGAPSETLGTGTHAVGVVATSPSGATASCTSWVLVPDTAPPDLQLAAQPVRLRLGEREEHRPVTIPLSACVAAATDLCDGTLDPMRAGAITRVRVLERERDHHGCRRDAPTIAGASVTVRPDEDALYRIDFAVADAQGNAATGTCDVTFGDRRHERHERRVGADAACTCCAGAGCEACPPPRPRRRE